MNIAELKNSVMDLGFEESLENYRAFINATNRAIKEVNEINPKKAVYSITQNSLENLIGNSKTMFQTVKFKNTNYSENSEYYAYRATSPRAYYFEADGKGTAYIERETALNEWETVETITLDSSRQYKAYKGLIDYESDTFYRIRFSGDYTYNIRNIAMYGEVYSDDEDDIPAFTPYVRYDIKELVGDTFKKLDKVVIYEGEYYEGKEYILNRDYFTEDGHIILLNYFDVGQFNIWYMVYPKKLTIDDGEETQIDIEDDLCHLLPELVAHYVWLEDKPDISQRYYDLYKLKAIELTKTKKEKDVPYSYKNTSGWA